MVVVRDLADPDPDDDEGQRLEALRRYEVLDTRPEPSFDRITRLASRLFEVPIALVSLVDEERQWFKSRVGLEAAETPREHAFCDHTIRAPRVLVVPDATRDERFRHNPLVTGPPHIRFYAGAPLNTPGGRVGTLCVIDRVPRELTDEQRSTLADLADLVTETLEHRLAMRASPRQEELLALAQELVGAGHWRVDLPSGALYWSRPVYAIHGEDPATYVPTVEGAIAAYHPEDRARVAASVQAAIERREPFDFELRLIRADGATRLVRSVGRPQVDPETDRVRAVVGVFQDITERESLRARLAQAEKMASIGTLAAGVAHEINNPLAYVQANAHALRDQIRQRADEPDAGWARELADMAEEIVDGTERVARIVGDLKTFARSRPREVRPVALRSVIETAARLCQNQIRHRAELRLVVAKGTPEVAGDEAELVQVMVNLLVNAAQSMSGAARGEITVRAGPEGDGRAFLEVADNGRGMSPEVLRQAFHPFFTTKPQGVGTGLGLSICHGIVTSIGGTIGASSTLGEGTRVRVVLPVADAAAAPSEPASSAPPPERASTRHRVLVVDDEAAVGRSMRRLLRIHDVECETDPLRAVQRIREGERFDAILCDLMMPQLGGVDVHRAVAETDPAQARRFALVTGGSLTPEILAAVEAAALPVLVKPVAPELLRETVLELAERDR